MTPKSLLRKTRRTYRPFSATEDRALEEGVKKYNGQRNVWSLILLDKDLRPQFIDRSNTQLRNRFHTMRNAAKASTLLVKSKRLPDSYQSLQKSQVMKSTMTQDREKSVQPQAQTQLASSQSQASANATQVAQNNQNQQQAYLQQYHKLQKQIQRRQLQQQQQQLSALIAATSNSSQQLRKSQSAPNQLRSE